MEYQLGFFAQYFKAHGSSIVNLGDSISNQQKHGNLEEEEEQKNWGKRNAKALNA